MVKTAAADTYSPMFCMEQMTMYMYGTEEEIESYTTLRDLVLSKGEDNSLIEQRKIQDIMDLVSIRIKAEAKAERMAN